MNEILATLVAWAVPALIVFGSAAAFGALAIWALRRSRRSTRARGRAEVHRRAAGVALVRLDDAVEEMDLEVALSGALYDGSAPPALRRATMTAQHARDSAFDDFRGLTSATHPDEIRRVARIVRSRSDAATATVTRARSEHDEWMRAHVSAESQIDAARERLRQLSTESAAPAVLVAALAERWDTSEWADAERDAASASAALADAERLIDDAADRAGDPTQSALTALADAERALRTAHAAARRVEERHRLVTDAATAVDDEVAAARTALRSALSVRDALEPADAERLGAELRAVEGALTDLEPGARRRPTATVDAVARLRDRLDLALGDARTAGQRLRGARTALPGTLAAARDAIARAEPRAARAGADARTRLGAAQRELAAARGAQDPVSALDAARRALRNAEDAGALADYDVLTKD